jgi:hypothetical protein
VCQFRSPAAKLHIVFLWQLVRSWACWVCRLSCCFFTLDDIWLGGSLCLWYKYLQWILSVLINKIFYHQFWNKKVLTLVKVSTLVYSLYSFSACYFHDQLEDQHAGCLRKVLRLSVFKSFPLKWIYFILKLLWLFHHKWLVKVRHATWKKENETPHSCNLSSLSFELCWFYRPLFACMLESKN